MNVVAVAGNFDPIRKGHLRLIKEASKLGDCLMVIVTRDDQAIKKKGYVFMAYEERKEILEENRWVDMVVKNIDLDITCRKSLEKYKPNIFARGGDLLAVREIKEYETCKKLGIRIVTGVGGNDKISSSSQIVKDNLKTICVDIDGVICENSVDHNYNEAIPDYGAIEKINNLYNMGHTIKYFTARGSSSGIDWKTVTEKQFNDWGVKYHKLIFGKPSFDYVIDDKSVKLEELI